MARASMWLKEYLADDFSNQPTHFKLGRRPACQTAGRFSPMPADNYSISSLFKILTICVHLRPKWDFLYYQDNFLGKYNLIERKTIANQV